MGLSLIWACVTIFNNTCIYHILPNDQKAFQLALYLSVKKKILDKLINSEVLGT